VTEVEVPLGADQWLGEITLKGLARYALNNYFSFGPGTWREREDREKGSTVQEENDLLLLYHDGNLSLLSFCIKEWSLDRRLWDPSIQGRWHPAFIWRWGHLDLQWLPLHMGYGPGGGWDCLLGCSPSFTLSMEVFFLSALVACPGSGAPSGGELPECSDKVLVF
jgi:hypothetical protein